MYEKERAKADVLIEAIPYMRKFAGSIVVVKYGGSAMVDERLKKSVIKDIALLKYIGFKPVVIHGGGKEITSLLDRLGKKTEFVDGLRVTDGETAAVAEMVLSGSIGKSLVENLEAVGIEACGINGKDGHTLQARKKVYKNGSDLGFVGEIEKVDMAVPVSPSELSIKRKAIYKHGSQNNGPAYPGDDPREFWQRAEDRNRNTADLYNKLGMAEYEAMEVFVRYRHGER